MPANSIIPNQSYTQYPQDKKNTIQHKALAAQKAFCENKSETVVTFQDAKKHIKVIDQLHKLAYSSSVSSLKGELQVARNKFQEVLADRLDKQTLLCIVEDTSIPLEIRLVLVQRQSTTLTKEEKKAQLDKLNMIGENLAHLYDEARKSAVDVGKFADEIARATMDATEMGTKDANFLRIEDSEPSKKEEVQDAIHDAKLKRALEQVADNGKRKPQLMEIDGKQYTFGMSTSVDQDPPKPFYIPGKFQSVSQDTSGPDEYLSPVLDSIQKFSIDLNELYSYRQTLSKAQKAQLDKAIENAQTTAKIALWQSKSLSSTSLDTHLERVKKGYLTEEDIALKLDSVDFKYSPSVSQSQTADSNGIGIQNQGATCYLNSLCQMLTVASWGKFGTATAFFEAHTKVTNSELPLPGRGSVNLPSDDASVQFRKETALHFKTLLDPENTENPQQRGNHIKAIHTSFTKNLPTRFMYTLGEQGDPSEMLRALIMPYFPDYNKMDCSAQETQADIQAFGGAVLKTTTQIGEGKQAEEISVKFDPVFFAEKTPGEDLNKLEKLDKENALREKSTGEKCTRREKRNQYQQSEYVGSPPTMTLVKRVGYNKITHTRFRNNDPEIPTEYTSVIFHGGSTTGGHYTALRLKKDRVTYMVVSDSYIIQDNMDKQKADQYVRDHGANVKGYTLATVTTSGNQTSV